MATTALAKKEETQLAVVKTHRAIILKEALQEASEQRSLLKAYVSEHMIEKVDYGPIPGAGEQKVLLKPGAEKLVELFRCTPKFALLRSEEKWEGNGFFNYMFRARIVSRDAKEVLAEGYGSANSHEGKHRWRNASRKCPACGKDSIIVGKPEYEKDPEYKGGWVCFKKKGGCGAKFKVADPAIALQSVGKVENTDAADLANTVLKMAKKRALVDAAIALARCSDMFTQDLDDDVHEPEPPAQPQRQEEPEYYGNAEPPDAPLPPQQAQPARVSSPEAPRGSATLRQRAFRVWETMKAGGASADAFKLWACEVLGHEKPSAQWSEADLEKLETAAHQGAGG